MNADGETIRGPLVLNYGDKKPLNGELTKKIQKGALKVPYSRPTDWYHKAKAVKQA